MPRLFFTGRKKIARSNVSVILRPGKPPEFEATIDLSAYRTLPKTARVVIEAYHNTMLQRFDFGTVADCRKREPLRLSNFEEWDRPRFRVRVIGTDSKAGMLLAACESINAIEPESGTEGGRSMLKLRPKPEREMRGELWKLSKIGNAYDLWYNKDVPRIASGIKSKQPDILGLILPAAVRQILERELIWRDAGESDEWLTFATITSGEPLLPHEDGEPPEPEELETWIDNVVAAFCSNRGRFIERIRVMEEADDESPSNE